MKCREMTIIEDMLNSNETWGGGGERSAKVGVVYSPCFGVAYFLFFFLFFSFVQEWPCRKRDISHDGEDKHVTQGRLVLDMGGGGDDERGCRRRPSNPPHLGWWT
jgi:hypothetical protein